ncbi:M23 family metallopeptidase [Cohnella luojiensis]|uniref:Peptidase M23 n=1 Tax=Cohnella luojiensis TaxID=652876 RepID=A0A4Y8LW31_9BACL|nr:M23 family metallopeptidase [Cohnella luojiensis]TFE25816.1 peptidase M23 [Cohnella luojiensis]
MRWRHKKFTFMVIPDANNKVMRFQLSAIILVTGLIIAAALLASSITAILLYQGNTGQIGELKQQLSSATGDYEQIIDGKNEHIDELQTDLADLSEQAKKINTRMNDIEKLESELKEMAGIETKDSDKAKVAGKSSTGQETDDEGQFAMDGGKGGEELPVTEEEMDLLVDQTMNAFHSLEDQIEWMKPELELTKEAVAKQQKLLAVTPTIWPTDSRRITSTFGIRKDPFTSRATYHAGLDIGGDTGDSIYAAADGTVIEAEYSSSHGNNVLIAHSNGLRTHYSHLSKILTEAGTKVSKGDIIAELGSTGRSTGPHLHYEVIINGENVDPRPYLKATRRSK